MVKSSKSPSNDQQFDLDELGATLDRALASNPALTEIQRADVSKLRDDMERLANEGRWEEARNCHALAMDLIRQGSPVPE